MPLYKDWPKNAVRPDEYTIDTTAFAAPLPIGEAITIVENLDAIFDVGQEKDSLALFCYMGGPPGTHSLRTRVPNENGYEQGLLKLDNEQFIGRVEIARKVDWKHFHAVCIFDRDASNDNKFVITSEKIKLKSEELECFIEYLRLILELPGRTFSLPDLPLIALINEMNGKT